MVLAINLPHNLLKPVKQHVRRDQRALHINRPAQLIDVLEHLVKAAQMLDDNVAMPLEDSERDEDVELRRTVVGPQRLPQP